MQVKPSSVRRRRLTALCWLRRAVFSLACAAMPVGATWLRAQAVLILQPGSTVATLAGSGVNGATKAGVATAAALGSPAGIAYDGAGNLYFADTRNHQVDRVDAAGQLTVVAGTGRQGYSGDGSAAAQAELNAPTGIAIDTAGSLYIADTGNHRIRRVSIPNGTITTVAGTGAGGFAGDGASAMDARFRLPTALVIDTTGALYIADTGNHRVRKLQANGTIVTVAGSGADGDDGDGRVAVAASLQTPSGLAFLPDGRLLIADRSAHRIRSLNLDGTLTAYSLTTSQPLRRPAGLAVDTTGNVYVADSANEQLVQNSTDGASVAAGSGEQGGFKAGRPTTTAMDMPVAVSAGVNSTIVYSDQRNHQVQQIQRPSLAFGDVPAGASSAAQTLALQNGGSIPLQVLAVSLPAGFTIVAAGTDCRATPFTLQPATQCKLALAFAPTAQGSASGLVTIRLDGGAPQSVLLTGTATASGTGAPSITTLRSDGTIAYVGAPVTLTASVATSLVAPATGNMTFYDSATVLGAGPLTSGSATLSTAAMQTGSHRLRATYSGDAAYLTSTSANVSLTVVPAPDFTLSASSASYSASTGGSVTIPLTLVPSNGTLNHAVSFSVSGLPSGLISSFSPATLTLGGDSVSVTLNVQVPSTLAMRGPAARSHALELRALWALPLLRRRRRLLLALAIPAGALLLCVIGCGSGFRGGTVAPTATTRSYPLVVTATTTGVLGNTLAHSSSVSLVISQ